LWRRGKTLGGRDARYCVSTLDILTGIIAPSGLPAVEFKLDRRTMPLYGLTDDEIAVVEGKK